MLRVLSTPPDIFLVIFTLHTQEKLSADAVTAASPSFKAEMPTPTFSSSTTMKFLAMTSLSGKSIVISSAEPPTQEKITVVLSPCSISTLAGLATIPFTVFSKKRRRVFLALSSQGEADEFPKAKPISLQKSAVRLSFSIVSPSTPSFPA